MAYPSPARHGGPAGLAAALAEADPAVVPDFELEGAAGPLGRAFECDGLAVSNRFAIHPMEGWDGTPEGSPGELTLRRWRHFGLSGAGLIWGGEAYAVTPEGRANPNQLVLRKSDQTARDLDDLIAALDAGRREAGLDPNTLVRGLQLTHSGRYARPDGTPAPRIAHHHPVLDPRLKLDASTPLLSDGELEAIAERYVALAKLAQAAGFHFVDVKACHGYLLHELLAARTRPGPYGGDLAGRARLMLRIIAEIKSACPGLRVGVRLSAFDTLVHGPDPESGVGIPLAGPEPFGEDPAESGALLAMLQAAGVRWLNVSVASPYTSPHLQRPSAYPPSDGYAPPEDPLHSVVRHIQVVRGLRQAAPAMALIGSGYSYLMESLPYLAQAEVRAGHVDLVGIGRLVLSYPDFPRDVLAGKPLDRKRICRTFSDCTNAPRKGFVSGCFPLDAIYKSRPEAAELLRSRPKH
ncbi:MAG: NADPH2 dehydrogenase [Planctomycetota bacterium]|jgi:NADPH2 dehydrogenase